MKTRMIASALLIMLLSIGISSEANANPWRRGYGYGYCRPHPVVRVYGPRVAVCAPPIVYGGYYAPRPRYYAPRYYAHPCYRPRYYRGWR